MQRQPNVLGNLGLYYKDSLFDARCLISFTGRTFTSDLNNIELPTITSSGWTRAYTYVCRGRSARIGISVYICSQHGRLGGLASPGHAAEHRPGLLHRRQVLRGRHHGSIVL